MTGGMLQYRHDIKPTDGTFTMKVPVHPCTIVVMLENSPPDKYFTQVQYVRTKDGKYHYLKSWTQIIDTNKASNGETGTVCCAIYEDIFDNWNNEQEDGRWSNIFSYTPTILQRNSLLR